MAGLHNLFLAVKSCSTSNSTHPAQDLDKCSTVTGQYARSQLWLASFRVPPGLPFGVSLPFVFGCFLSRVRRLRVCDHILPLLGGAINDSSAGRREPLFTNGCTRANISSKQLLGFKSTLTASASLTTVGTLEQGSAWRGRKVLRNDLSFWGGLRWKGFTGRGSARLEAWDINGNAFSVQQQAAEELIFISLFLFPPQREDGVKETHTRNISGKEWPNQFQFYPQGRCSKPGNEPLRIKHKCTVKKLYIKNNHVAHRRTRKMCWPSISHDPRATWWNHRLNLWLSSCLLHEKKKKNIISTHWERKFEISHAGGESGRWSSAFWGWSHVLACANSSFISAPSGGSCQTN